MGIMVEVPKQYLSEYEGGKVFHARHISDILEDVESTVYPDEGMSQAEITADVAAKFGHVNGAGIQMLRALKFHRV